MLFFKDSLLSFPLPKTDGIPGSQFKLGTDNTGTIEYNLNKHGYRTPEFESIDWTKSLVCFGCSVTLGIGVDEKNSWPTKLGEFLKISIVNLGQGGVGIDYIVAQLVFLLNQGYYPKKIAVVWPAETRIYYWGEGSKEIQERDDLKNFFCQNDIHMLRNAQINITAFNQLSKHIPLVEMTWSNFLHLNLKISKWRKVDLGTDKIHPGPKSHLLAAEYMRDQFLSLNN